MDRADEILCRKTWVYALSKSPDIHKHISDSWDALVRKASEFCPIHYLVIVMGRLRRVLVDHM